nr:exodeoxyribonuclease VII large subunit [Clostridiales bacterium]
YIDDMQPDGLGALSVAFEQLKERLAKEGLFDERNKKPIPEMPMRVGVITSPTGAAIRDIINVLGRRFPMAEVIFCPVRVQGDLAAPQIARAIKLFNDEKKADVLIVGRGGGSLEDLWAFNEEIVARAVAASEIPVISAVGHETDYTICDFASDLRAPTPSAAAELAVPDMRVQYDFISSALLRCKKAMRSMIDSERTRLFDLRSSPYISSAVFIVDSQRLILDSLTDKLKGCVTSLLEKEKNTLGLSAGKLDAISPLKVLSRGYAIAEKDGRAVTIDNINEHDKIDVKIKDASLLCEVLKITESDGDGYGK